MPCVFSATVTGTRTKSSDALAYSKAGRSKSQANNIIVA
jgi:hypothetical protein